MSRFNHGIIHTNDNCIGCNKCISDCPVLYANISVYRNGRKCIDVDGNKCIHCGHCINVCTHDAREYDDDTEAFFAALESGEKLALAVAPSFYILFPETANAILGYLRQKGVGKIYDVAYGADIATWCHLKYFDEHTDNREAYISQACPAVTNYAECCAPEMLKHLVPVQSPVVCLGIYVHKYLRDDSKIAFLSPCIAKTDDITSPKTGGSIAYNVTFKHLLKRLSGVSLEGFSAKSDLSAVGLGSLFPTPGGFKEYVEHFVSGKEMILQSDDLPGRYERMRRFGEAIGRHGRYPLLVDILHCDYGCLTGPATCAAEYDIVTATSAYLKIRSEKSDGAFDDGLPTAEKKRLLYELFEGLEPADFAREFTDRYRQPFIIPETTYDEIFNDMNKRTDADRAIDCHSCGYPTCRDMVTAIANGYNRKENCIHYMNAELTRLYYTDPLTGIPNEASFLRDAGKLLDAHPDTRFVACTADINDFMVINDLYGFEGGDKVLNYLASRAEAFVEGQGVCARLDTDHFALCFPYTDENIAELRATEYYDCSHISIGYPVSMRFGLYIIEDPDQPMNKLLDLASIARDRAADRSRNSFNYYNDEMRDALLLEARIAAQMRESLQNEEFAVYLQPQYDHASGTLVGAEALCRWIRYDGAIISPALFIPIFEKNGFIRELDRYMWAHTFALLRKWIDEGIEIVPLSVNVSRISLLDGELPETIERLRAKYDVPPEFLHLEVTESAYMRNQKLLIDQVNCLRAQGFCIAMDDFGSGYSSLNTLKDVPIDILKLDMGFLAGESNGGKGGNIISSVLRMAQGLNLSTIAEGVETIEQADFLKSLGCDAIQGFLYARPMPSEAFEALLRSPQRRELLRRPNTLEKIDVNSFFDPNSGETKMFDNYAGAAMVFEFEGGRMSIIRINDKYLTMLGLAKESNELIRVRFLETLSPDSLERLIDAVNAAISNGAATCTTERKNPLGGSTIWIKSHFWLVGTNGARYTLYALAENISELKNSERALVKSNDQMRMIMENVQAGICLYHAVYDSTGGGRALRMSIISVNRHFLDMFGYSEKEVLRWTEKDALRVIHPLDRPEFLRKVRSSVNPAISSPTLSQALRMENAAGEYISIELTAAGIPENENSLWIVANYASAKQS